MSEIRHIVFDIGRVLVHYDAELPFLRLIPDSDARKWFLDNVCTSPWNIEQDRGRSWEEAEAELLAEHPGQEENIRNFRKHWHEMVPHAYDESVAILDRLIDAGYDVTLLTNWAADTFMEARERFPFLDRPRGITVSGEIRKIKPDRAIYDHHATAFELDPAATLFIDDSQKNVDGAKSAGWQAILFTDAAQLEKDLRALGIRLGAHDPAKILRRYHDATNRLDYAELEASFAENAVYISQGVGGTLSGRAAIMAGFRAYFADYGDQVAEDSSIEALSADSALSVWRLSATSARTGKPLLRNGTETIRINHAGKIVEVVVTDA